jgi:hypothetical protein
LVDQVDHVEALREPHEILVVVKRAGPLSGLDVEDVRWAAHGCHGQMAAADRDGPVRRSAHQLELARGASKRPAHLQRAQFRHMRRRIDGSAVAPENVAGFGVQHAHPRLLQEVERRRVKRLHLIVGKQPDGFEGIDQPSIGRSAGWDGVRGGARPARAPARRPERFVHPAGREGIRSPGFTARPVAADS